MMFVWFDEVLKVCLFLEFEFLVFVVFYLMVKDVWMFIYIDDEIDVCLNFGDVEFYMCFNYVFYFYIYCVFGLKVLLLFVDSLWFQFVLFMWMVYGWVGIVNLQDWYKEVIWVIEIQNVDVLRIVIGVDIFEGMGILGKDIFIELFVG